MSIGGTQASLTRCKIAKTQSRLIDVGCEGVIFVDISDSEKKAIYYEYKCTLSLAESLSISAESLLVSGMSSDNRRKTIFKATRDKSIHINISDRKELGPCRLPGLEKRKSFTIDLKRSPSQSFFGVLSGLFYYAYEIHEDITNFQFLNIDPHLAKEPNDILEPSTLLPNGKRLANALAALDNKNKAAFAEVNSFLTQICPRYNRVIPETDDHKSIRSFSVIDKFGTSCPARSLSDGTIKTIALLTAIHAHRRATIVIEEPENYLHPWACQILVDHFRSFFEQSVCILTTHSETLLNSIKPSEIIICSNECGATKGVRLEDPKQVNQAVSATGFGCGYHYVTGAFGGIPV